MERELDYKAIGKRVKIARIKADMKQEHVAEKSGLSPTHISNIETGTTKASLSAIVSVANAIGVTVDDLLCDSLLQEREAFEGQLVDLAKDCSPAELRILTEQAQSLKDTLRKHLK